MVPPRETKGASRVLLCRWLEVHCCCYVVTEGGTEPDSLTVKTENSYISRAHFVSRDTKSVLGSAAMTVTRAGLYLFDAIITSVRILAKI
jgi:hypothetical protein